MAHKLPMTHEPVFEQLGESQVRMQFVAYADDIGVQAREWLLLKEQARAEITSSKRDAREEETLSIARSAAANASEALRIAKHERTIAIAAAIAAIVAAAAAMYPLIKSM
jgi:hypothetical protein